MPMPLRAQPFIGALAPGLPGRRVPGLLTAGLLAPGLLVLGLLAGMALAAPAAIEAQSVVRGLPPVGSLEDRNTAQVLRVGDQVVVQVWRQPEFSGEFFVTEEGGLSHPLLKQVRASLRTPDEVRASLEFFLTGFEAEPNFVVEAFYRVVVGGEVRSPGAQMVRAGSVVTDVLLLAGGPTERGDPRRVVLRRGGQAYGGNIQDPNSQFRSVVLHSGDELILERETRVFQDYVRPTVTFVGSLSSIAWIIIQVWDRR
jgi:polysaccharide export outer membrane protein